MQGSYYNPSYNDLEKYVVKQNDSLYLIAKKYHITVDDLKQANHLVSNMIYPNQILFIPKTSTQTIKTDTYTTKSGDSVQKIIDKYHSELTDLEKYRDIGNLKVEPNQTLKLYSHDKNKFYQIKSGDTIEDILAKFHLSPLEFLKLNEGIFLKDNSQVIVG